VHLYSCLYCNIHVQMSARSSYVEQRLQELAQEEQALSSKVCTPRSTHDTLSMQTLVNTVA
jgi:hypothetical protein